MKCDVKGCKEPPEFSIKDKKHCLKHAQEAVAKNPEKVGAQPLEQKED